MTLSYRPNVAAIILNQDGLILTCQRNDIAGAWQIPQGGIEAGERPIDAFFRELKEEIGTDQVDLIGQLPDTIKYDWPAHLHQRGHCGQEQWSFLARISNSAQINLSANDEVEFATYEWLTSSQFFNRVSGFKTGAYKEAISKFNKIFPGQIK